MSETDLQPLDERQMAFLEQEQLGMETLDRIYLAGARESDVKYIAWMAGLTNWKPERRV